MKRCFALASSLVWFVVGAWGQEASEYATIYQRIAALEQPHIRLVADLDSILEGRYSESYQEAELILMPESESPEVWEVEIRNRGRFRRRACDFPPIKIKFSNKELEAAGYERHNELKLVTHCLDDQEGEENLRQEYLAYKLYEQLSPVHYRATLLEVTYEHTEQGKAFTRQAILLEDEKELADRLDASLCEDCYGRPDSAFDRHNLQTLTLFQYMIGNPDWSIIMARNVKLLQPDTGGPLLAAPYDFDFTGLVDASYARPDPTLGIQNVRDRKLIGPLASSGDLEEGIAEFREREEEILQFVDEFPDLKRSERRGCARYLKSFFNELKRLPEGGSLD